MNAVIHANTDRSGAAGTVPATEEQFELAARIREAQACLLRWERDWPRPNPKKDPEGYAQYKQIRKWSIEDCHEKLLVLTGNPRGFLDQEGGAAAQCNVRRVS